MTPEEYWNKLEADIEEFDKKNIAPSSEQDSKEYEKQKKTLLEVAKIAHEANQCWTPKGKKECLEKAEKLILNQETFGKKGIPAIVGKKTRDFVESVYIPHLQDREKIDFGLQGTIFNTVLKLMDSDDTLEARIHKAQIKAKILTERIDFYDKIQHSLFASPSNSDSAPQIKEVKSLSPR